MGGSVTHGFEKASKLAFRLEDFRVQRLALSDTSHPIGCDLGRPGRTADTDGVHTSSPGGTGAGFSASCMGAPLRLNSPRMYPSSWPGSMVDRNPPRSPTPTSLQSGSLRLKTRNSAAYKGLYALLLKEGGLDFRSGETINQQSYFDEKIDIHHIFPQQWCRNNGIEPKRCDCIVNKTPISAKTNRMIGGNPPSNYLGRIQKSVGHHAHENGLNPGIARDRTGRASFR